VFFLGFCFRKRKMISLLIERFSACGEAIGQHRKMNGDDTGMLMMMIDDHDDDDDRGSN
jgi:hypothetical protein